MTVTYGIIKEVYTFQGERRVSYGVAAYADADLNGTSAVIASIHDITSDRESLSERIQKFNRSALSVLHFDDAITDLLAE